MASTAYVEAVGFDKAVIERVQVNVAKTAKVLAKMQVAKVGTEVIVSAEQSVVQTESAELKNSVDRRQIMDLPLPSATPLTTFEPCPGSDPTA